MPGECPVCDDGTKLEETEVDIGGGPDTHITIMCPKCGYDQGAGH